MGIRLLTISMQTLKTGVVDFFTRFNAIYGVEIFLLFLLIYYVSKVLRDNDATKLMLVYWCLFVVGGCMYIFAPELINKTFFLFYVILISAFMLILFNVEVKKSLWDVHATKPVQSEKTVGGHTEIRSQADTEHCISNIIN